MTRPKRFPTYISATFNSLGYIHRIPPRKSLSLTSSLFIYGQGRTSASVPDIMNIGHTCVIPGFFFGDGRVEYGWGWVRVYGVRV